MGQWRSRLQAHLLTAGAFLIHSWTGARFNLPERNTNTSSVSLFRLSSSHRRMNELSRGKSIDPGTVESCRRIHLSKCNSAFWKKKYASSSTLICSNQWPVCEMIYALKCIHLTKWNGHAIMHQKVKCKQGNNLVAVVTRFTRFLYSSFETFFAN